MIAGTRLRRGRRRGITTIEFLAPPSACTRLPVCGRSAVDDQRAVSAWPTKEIASTPAWSRIAVDRVAAAVDEVDDARREISSTSSISSTDPLPTAAGPARRA